MMNARELLEHRIWHATGRKLTHWDVDAIMKAVDEYAAADAVVAAAIGQARLRHAAEEAYPSRGRKRVDQSNPPSAA
jgi:hypothetical protein